MTTRSRPMPSAKPLYSSGVNAAVAQYLGMYHAAAQNLNPALALAQAAAFAVAVEALHVNLSEGSVKGK